MTAGFGTKALSTATAAGAESSVMFGRFKLSSENQVFYASKHCLGIVNLKVDLARHVLVIPKRVAPRLMDLTDEESQDLMNSVRKISPKIEEHYKATALNIAMQDGKDAGQSVPHVHIHILPRIPKDIEPNDKVYEAIESWNQKGGAVAPVTKQRKAKLEVPKDEDRKPRTMEEMGIEARELRALFPDNNVPPMT
eukprot:jgi/Bigna1/87580/estExt_fgenesh1_pg.C_220022